MAKRSKGSSSKTLKLLESRLDLRVPWNKRVWKVTQEYVKKKSPRLGVIQGILEASAGRKFKDFIERLDVLEYQKDVDTRCMCSRKVKKESYVVGIRGTGRKEGIEGQIIGKIKDKVKLSKLRKSAEIAFIFGPKCYENFPEVLSDLRLVGRFVPTKKAVEAKGEKLEQLVNKPSKKLIKALEAYGLSYEQIESLKEVIGHNFSLEEASLLYNLDAGRKSSFANWFREGIRKGEIDDGEIKEVYERLMKVPQTVSDEELASLVTYAYEFRKFDSKAVIGGIREDLEYLASLGEDSPHKELTGTVNLNKHYVRPQTRFRKRNDLEDVMIREKINQSHLSLLEVLGVKLHFPEIYHIRRHANSEVSNKLMQPSSWVKVLSEVEKLVESEKKDLAKEYGGFGKIIFEHVLSKREYKLAKEFIKRSKIGRDSPLVNLRNRYSIKEFREVAPVVAMIGGKVRFANKIYKKSGDELLKEGLMKQEYFLGGEADKLSEETFGKRLVYVLRNLRKTRFVEDREFLDFQKNHVLMLINMYQEGIVAKKYLSPVGRSKKSMLQKVLDVLRKEGVVEVGKDYYEDVVRPLERYLNNPFVVEADVKLSELKGWDVPGVCLPKKKVKEITDTFNSLEELLKEINWTRIDREEFDKNFKAIKEKGKGTYIESDDYHLFMPESYSVESWQLIKSDSNAAVYNVPKIMDVGRKLRSGTKVHQDLVRKLKLLNNEKVMSFLGLTYERHHNNRFDRFEKACQEGELFTSAVFSAKVNKLFADYERDRSRDPLEVSIQMRRGMWKRHKGAWWLSRDLENEVYNKLVSGRPGMWEVINGVAGGYMKEEGGKKVFVRKSRPKYLPQEGQWGRFAFRRFIGSIYELADLRNVASGAQAEFKIHDNVYQLLGEDLQKGRITEKKHDEYRKVIGKFEGYVNSLIRRTYSPPNLG